MKEMLINKHNLARKDVANGNVAEFKTADRMIEMSWDDELASFAEMNAKICTFKHDKCRNAVDFKYAGQNRAIITSSPDYDYYHPTEAINILFRSWYDEYKDCDTEQIKNITEVEAANGKFFGHFTQIIMANSSKIGCAMVNYFIHPWKYTTLVCDYSQTNVIGWPVYTVGSPCSGCTTECSKRYRGLCSVDEVV